MWRVMLLRRPRPLSPMQFQLALDVGQHGLDHLAAAGLATAFQVAVVAGVKVRHQVGL
jgi:hypothetical protein